MFKTRQYVENPISRNLGGWVTICAALTIILLLLSALWTQPVFPLRTGLPDSESVWAMPTLVSFQRQVGLRQLRGHSQFKEPPFTLSEPENTSEHLGVPVTISDNELVRIPFILTFKGL